MFTLILRHSKLAIVIFLAIAAQHTRAAQANLLTLTSKLLKLVQQVY